MNLYRIYSIKEHFLKYFQSDMRREVSAFFRLENIFKIADIYNLYISNNHVGSIFVDEKALKRIQDKTVSNYGVDIELDSISSEAIAYNKNIQTEFHLKHPSDVVSVIKNHVQQDHIQQMIKDRKEELKISAGRKEILRSRIYNEHDKKFHNKRTVSIDFEYYNLDVFEIGISIYENGNSTNYHYLIAENYINKKTKPELQFKFHFGETTIISETDIATILQKHFEGADYLLLHGHSNDYLILNKYGFDVEKENNIMIMDTILYYQKYFNPNQGDALTLKQMLYIFDIEPKDMHNSGNDAYFTLELFIKMYNKYDELSKTRILDVA